MGDSLERAIDAAAEALILLDVEDPSSIEMLIASLDAVAHAAGIAPDADGPLAEVRALALACGPGGGGSLAGVDRAFDAARVSLLSQAPTASDKPKATSQTVKARTKSSSKSLAAKAEQTGMPLAGDVDLLRDFAVRAAEHLDDADERLLALEANPDDGESVDAVFRAFHTIKGMAGFLALDDISTAAHESENRLAAARSGDRALSSEEVAALFEAVDTMRRLVAIAVGESALLAASASEVEVSAGTVIRTATAPAAPEAPQRLTAEATSARAGTVRVSQERLDALLDTIGELVIAESTVSAGVRESREAGHTIGKLDQLDKITRELQQMATSLRMVQLRPTMRRMARLVRDVAQKAGKQVEFITSGEDTELDKTVVDRIEDPLVHALRNAIDHGIETAEERVAAGKDPVGRVELRAFHAGGSVHIEVIDDGRGLDADRIRSKASAAGLGDSAETRSLLDLICAPGLSTALKVTDVSGRGVGMDVVRRAVEDLRGRLEVTSAPGSGTTFLIRLPVTLAIIDGMVLRVGEERFILPLQAIDRSVRPVATDISTVAARGEMISIGDELLPILRLHRLFDIENAEQDPTQSVVVVTRDSGMRAGLLACELLGQQQTVIKPLGEGLPDTQGIAGGAVMPDGRVGLILDAAGLVRLARDKGGE